MPQLLFSLSLRFGASTAALGHVLRQCGNPELLHHREALIQRFQPKGAAHRLKTLNHWWHWFKHSEWQLIGLHHKAYPTLLACLSDAPGVLYARGNLDLLNMPQLAMVGARHASPDGLMHAERFAKELSQYGFCITSGLALDRKSTRLNSSHVAISYAVFCLKKKNK